MSDRENLLNNLKIDRSAAPSEENSPSNKLYLLGAAVLLVSFFWWLFLSDDELKEVTTFTVKSLQIPIPQPRASLMPLAMLLPEEGLPCLLR